MSKYKPRTTRNSQKADSGSPFKTHTSDIHKTSCILIPKQPTASTLLKNRIVEAEEQLMQKEETVNQPSTQTKKNIPLKMGTKSMVTPGNRDVPKFSSRKPYELWRFVRMMEDLWQEANITEDEEKKESIGKYADQESEEEWKALDTYEKGYSWGEFKEELISNYPEAAAAE